MLLLLLSFNNMARFHFLIVNDDIGKETIKDLQLILKSGLSSLLTSNDDRVDQLDIEDIVGLSADDKWVIQTDTSTTSTTISRETDSKQPDNMYQYEGVACSYSL